MIRIAIIATIAYYSIGYAIRNPDQASILHKSASNMVSVVYKKAKSFIGELNDDNEQVITMPTQKVSIYL